MSEENPGQRGRVNQLLPEKPVVNIVGARTNIAGTGLNRCPEEVTRVDSTVPVCSLLGTREQVDGPALSNAPHSS